MDDVYTSHDHGFAHICTCANATSYRNASLSAHVPTPTPTRVGKYCQYLGITTI